ncbi:hypothetical protein AVEN_157195-1 [Araneus ventricosus]|uniref:Uncharacterized protein n=1 Tax=Araneus ventricosus TaxID=182803 RepID=A0A4Y2EEC2_ARAVE|nr:hypothetical protein AVEN_157195-1 [Araneus ventricosus]
MRPIESSHKESYLANMEANPFLCQYIWDNPTLLLFPKYSSRKRNTFSVRCGREPSCMNHSILGRSCVLTKCSKIVMYCNVTLTRDRFSHEKRADNPSAAYRNPSSNYRRMQWFLFTQMRIFGTPKSPVLFIHESIQVEMCFICEPDAANIKSFIINHCENLVRKVKPLSHSFFGYGLMTLDFVWKHP